MEERKSHEKEKIASSLEKGKRRSEETMSQSWKKKRREDEYYDGTSSWKSDVRRKHNIYWSSLSERGRRIEDTRRREDPSPMKKGKLASSSGRERRRRDEYDGASSWKRKSNGEKQNLMVERITEDDARRRRSEDTRDVSSSSWKTIERGSKKRSEGTNDELLNHDVLEQVMLRLPVKSLIRFQTVSKHWRRMITSMSFKKRHMMHQKTQEPKVGCYYRRYRSYRSCWYMKTALKTMRLEWSSTCLVEEEGYHIRNDKTTLSNSIDGLVCFYSFTREIAVINPATRWSYKLPLANIQLDNNDLFKFPLPGFGKDYITGTYKIVWLHNINKYNTTLLCEIFDFRAKQWRQVTPPPPDHCLNNTNIPTFANGWLYWFHLDATKLIAFDLHMEMFQVIPNPIIETSSSSVVDMHIGSIDDDRQLVWASETNGDGMQHVWRLTNHNTGGALLKMDKMFSIDLNKISSTSTFLDPRYNTLLFFIYAISKNGNKVMILNVDHSPILFQPLNSTYHIFSYSPLRPIYSHLIPFFPSLVSPFMN